MAEWPANGEEDWNTKMKAFIDVGHNSDGTLNHVFTINGTATTILTKYLTGTLDADSNTAVAHGIANGLTKILSVSAHAYDDVLAKQVVMGNREVASASGSVRMTWDDTNINFVVVGADIQGNAYKIKIDYQE